MELKSDPSYPTRAVTDVTFRFLGGLSFVVRLIAGQDKLNIEESHIQLLLHNDKGDLQEEQYIERANLLHWTVKDDMETVYPPGESPVEKEVLRREIERVEREKARSEELQNRRLDKFYR